MMVPLVAAGAVVVLGVIAVAVVAIARMARGTGQPVPSAETPLAILKRRYAQGEVSSEQFEVAKRQLSGDENAKGD